jgi:Xaa-Pro dipeptidase
LTAQTADPSDEELASRHGRFHEVLERLRLDGAILTRPENIYYLSDYRAASIAAWTARLHALVVPTRGRPRLLARALESRAAAVQRTPEPILWADHEDPYQRLVGALSAEEGWSEVRRLGVEARFLTVAQHSGLQAVLPGVELVDISGVVEALAERLSPWEVDCVRRAATVTTYGMDAAMASLKVGRYPYEVVAAVQDAMYSAGQSDFEKSFVAVWSGPQGGMMHDTRTTVRLAEGDIATIEVMGVDRHYRTCAQTTVWVGSSDPSDDVRAAYELVVAMHDSARAAVRAGVTAGAVFDAADALYLEHTGEHYFRRVGGSIGLTMFAVDLVRDSPVVLRAGTPLLVQVLVNEPALLTCTSSVIVTETGVEELTPALVADGLRRPG